MQEIIEKQPNFLAHYISPFHLPILAIGAAMASVLTWASHATFTTLPFDFDFTIYDKQLHVIAYFGLTGVIILALKKPLTHKVKWQIAKAIFFFGLLEECTQHFVGRSANILDLLADVVGITLALIVICALRKYIIKS